NTSPSFDDPNILMAEARRDFTSPVEHRLTEGGLRLRMRPNECFRMVSRSRRWVGPPPSSCAAECFSPNRYLPFTREQWVEAVFHVPESFTQVSLQMTVRARCVPLSSASYVNV